MTETANPAGSAPTTAETATSKAADVAQTGKAEVAKVGEEVKSQTSKLVGEVSSQARERADGQLVQVADLLGHMSDELDRMSAGASEPDGYLAAFAREGASVARNASDRLQRDGLDGALTEVKGFARRQPVLFLAAAFTTGIALGRLTRNADLGRIAKAAQGTDSDAPSDEASGSLSDGPSTPGGPIGVTPDATTSQPPGPRSTTGPASVR